MVIAIAIGLDITFHSSAEIRVAPMTSTPPMQGVRAFSLSIRAVLYSIRVSSYCRALTALFSARFRSRRKFSSRSFSTTSPAVSTSVRVRVAVTGTAKVQPVRRISSRPRPSRPRSIPAAW